MALQCNRSTSENLNYAVQAFSQNLGHLALLEILHHLIRENVL